VIGTAARAVIAASGRSDLILSDSGDLPVASKFGQAAVLESPSEMPGPLYLRAPDAKPSTSPLRKINRLTIENVGSGASEVLSELHGELFDDGWSPMAFATLLETPGAMALIASELGEPFGFLLTRSAADEAEIITIGTRPSLQRRGVARQLLHRQIASLAEQGVQHLFLEVAASNTPAQALYAAVGFREAGRRKGYYKRQGGVEDAIVMRRELHP